MAGVYGNKVKEPTVTRRTVLPVDGRASYAADLAKAWSSFGEAKNVLQQLESKSGSPPGKNSAPRYSKQHAVTFNPQPATTSQSPKVDYEPVSSSSNRVAGILKGSKRKENGKENVYIVEPPVLNEPKEVDEVQRSPGGQDVRATYTHTETTQKETHSQRSSQSKPTPVASGHSAVFGPPVIFAGSTNREGPGESHSRSHTSQPPKSYGSSKYTSISSPGPSTESVPHSGHPGSKRNFGGEGAAIRKFELPPEVVGALSAKVELQKQAVRDKNVGHTRTRGELNGHTTRPHRDYKPSGYQAHTTKKRKVASAPPPPSYTGFSSARSAPYPSLPKQTTDAYSGGTLQWKPNVEKVGMTGTKVTLAPPKPKVQNSSKKVGERVRKVRRMTSPDPNSKPRGIITTSSWRTGKQLADKILRDERKTRFGDSLSPRSSSPPSSVHSSLNPDHSPTQERSGKHTGDGSGKEPLSTWTKERKFDDILVDLELSQCSSPEEKGVQRSGDGGEGVKKTRRESKRKFGSKKASFNCEPTYPTERVRHYDQTKVQAYMQRQKEERRKKVFEQKQSLTNASTERQKKLQELYDAQRKRVEVNLKQKQKKREDYAKSLATGVHIHLRDPVNSSNVSEDSSLPTLTINPAPTTTYRSRHLDKPSASRTASYLHPSHTSPPSHLHPSPPSHPSPGTSPTRHNRLRPRETSRSPQRVQSPSQSNSPRTYTLHLTADVSPGRQATGHAQLSPRSDHTPPRTGTLAGQLRGGSFVPSPPRSPRTHEERLQAIKASALRLKERIAKESKKVLEGSYTEPNFNQFREHYLPSDRDPLRYHHQVNEQGGPPPVDLPGVHSMRDHALQAEQQRRETEAACKIQAAFRGYNVRKSLKWELPSGRTLNSVMKGANPSSSNSERQNTTPKVSKANTQQNALVQPSQTYSPPVSTQDTPSVYSHRPNLTPREVEPWKQDGGDAHSVINVFTRQQERLRETLSLLSDRKREEIRSMASSEMPLESFSGSQVLETPSKVSREVSNVTGQSPDTYTQNFDPDSSLQDEVSGLNESQVSTTFSQDSLFSQTTPPEAPLSQSHPEAPLNSESPPSRSHTAQSSSTESVTRTSPRDIPAITPPGSPSFVDSFSSHTPTHIPFVPSTNTVHSGATGGRLSPRSLELKHQAQLNLYETVEEHLRHLSHVERTRDVSLAQHETVSLAQQLKTQEQTRKDDVSTLATKAKHEIEAVQKQLESETKQSSDRMKHLQEQVDSQMKEHSKRLTEMQEESARAARDATLRLNEARTVASTAVIEAAQQQIQAAHTMAVSVATAATKEAVREALRNNHQEQMATKTDGQEYESDFEPSTVQPDSLVGSGDECSATGQSPPPRYEHSATGPTSPPESIEDGSGKDNTLTPVSGGPGDRTLVDGEEMSSQNSSPQEVAEEDINEEMSFSSRGHHRNQSQHSLSDSEGVASPSLGDHTPSLGDQSPYSPAGEDSFFMFTNRMVTEYVKEEELRAKHRAALLELREKALQEKTEAKLKWLKLKKNDLRSKGADDLMPPLRRKEKGLLRGFQQEQAKIRRLKEAQEAASHERKLMLLEQKEISKMRQSSQFYRDKIRSYRSRANASPSPAPSNDESISSHAPHDYSRSMTPDYSIFSDLSGVDESHDTSAAPSEHLETMNDSYSATFPTYSPSSHQDGDVRMETSSRVDQSGSIREDSSPRGDTTLSQDAKRKSLSPLVVKKREKLATGTSDSITLKHLRKLASNEAERYLAERELSIQKRRQAAEKAIQKHRELLKKEIELDKEEASVNKLVDEAMEMLRHTSLTSRGRHSGDEPLMFEPRPFDPASVSNLSMSEHLSQVSKTPGSVSEETTSSIAEDLSVHPGTVSSAIPSEYAGDTFESMDSTLTPPHHTHPVTTLTPPQPVTTSTPEPQEELSLTHSARVTESVTDSISSTTSGGSVLEARIRALKEQLRQKKEDVKRVQNEQKRKKKAILKQQEEQLQRKLEAVDLKAKRVISSSPPPRSLSPDTRTPSTISVASEVEPRESSPEFQDSSPSREGSPIEEEYQTDSSVIHSDIEYQANTQTRDEAMSPMLNEEISSQTNVNKESVSEIREEPSVSYTPFFDSELIHSKSEEDEELTSRLSVGTESTHTLSEGIAEVPTLTDLESNISSVEALVPPPGFEGQPDEGQTNLPIEPPSFIDSSIPEQLLSEQNSSKLTSPSRGVISEDGLSGDNLSEEEEANHRGYSEDFEPENTPQPDFTDNESMDARSDTSLPISISGSKGGDSDEETNYHVGQRVLVGGVMEGVVQFVGHTHFSSGLWIGVEFDHPRGRNDGSIDGEVYFTCPPKHGLFAPPRKVKVIEDIVDDETLSEEGSGPESTITEELESAHSEIESDEEETKLLEEGPINVSGSKKDYTEDFEPSLGRDKTIDESSQHITPPHVDNAPSPNSTLDTLTEQVTGDSVSSEQQAPAAIQSVGEKPDSLPSAPDVTLQRSHSATPTPAPPPEFAEGASREASTEPPAVPTTVEPFHADRKPEKLSDEITQELMNEAYETMHQIWKSKRDVETVIPDDERKTVEVVQVPKDKDIPLSLDEKADRITDQLLSLLLQSESSLITNIRSNKELEESTIETQTEPKSPTKLRRHPPLQISLNGTTSIKESSPPPISPPSPYRHAMMFTSGDHSPPGSPPCHLSQVSAARVAAGEKSLFVQPETSPPPPPVAKLERTSSTESIVQILDTIKLTTAQCMVPSERPQVDDIVQSAWRVAHEVGFDSIHSQDISCPPNVLGLFKDVRELSPEEEHCHQAYIKLVFDLTLEVIKNLHPAKTSSAAWLQNCTVKAPLASNGSTSSLELVQKRVYAALIRGQLPSQLPAVRFLHRKKRPGGKEVDFVDGILIKELRFEEPGWTDYHKDETTVKMRTADNILDSLLSEAVQIMCSIEQKRRTIS